MRFVKKNLTTIILILIFCIGLCLMLYPSVSNYWNSFHQSRYVASYAETVANMDDKKYQEILSQARAYNEKLSQKAWGFEQTEKELEEYYSTLNVDAGGIMAYIEIPAIDCLLPIYHGADESVLQIAVGHIPGSALPIGGKGNHCVLSGHRGLPSARLFTDIDKLVVGDTFTIRTLNEILTYEVDKISIVLPENVDCLQPDAEEDYCSLVTCTPYGVNTHRLIVRGHRIANEKGSSIRLVADAQRIEPLIIAPIVAAFILFIILLRVLFSTPGKRKK